MGNKLTKAQTRALEWLAALHEKFPQNDYGFNPTYRAGDAATCRRSLAAKGLVHLNRLSDHHIRYSITDAGRRQGLFLDTGWAGGVLRRPLRRSGPTRVGVPMTRRMERRAT